SISSGYELAFDIDTRPFRRYGFCSFAMAQRSFSKRLWYDFLRVVCRVLGVAVFRIRVFGREHVPNSGGVLVVSNHQSHLDPVLVGLAFDRRLNYVARDTLFGFAPFA